MARSAYTGILGQRRYMVLLSYRFFIRLNTPLCLPHSGRLWRLSTLYVSERTPTQVLTVRSTITTEWL